jgi:hypothetical protein
MTRLPRAIRLDASDLSVFDIAAEPGEWAVPGSFSFLAAGPEALRGRRRAAFANGFLGTDSFGWTTLVIVEEASPAEIAGVISALAVHFLRIHGAPSMAEAEEVARREISFAGRLCEHPPGTILALSRRFEGDDLVEQFRTITPDPEPCGPHAPIDLARLARVDG